ncbi:hypothetical protein D1872_243790 [compost metagenome]
MDSFLYFQCTLLHFCNSCTDFLLNSTNQVRDLIRRLTRFLGKITHFFRNDGKSSSLLTGTGSFDPGIKSEQIRLLGNSRYKLTGLSNLCCLLTKEINNSGKLIIASFYYSYLRDRISKLILPFGCRLCGGINSL